MKIRKKHEIDAAIAAELGLTTREVRDITRAFLGHVKEALSEMEEVHLSEFGRFRTVIEKPPTKPVELTQVTHGGKKRRKKRVVIYRKVRVHFSKARAFNSMMRAKHGPNAEKKS